MHAKMATHENHMPRQIGPQFTIVFCLQGLNTYHYSANKTYKQERFSKQLGEE